MHGINYQQNKKTQTYLDLSELHLGDITSLDIPPDVTHLNCSWNFISQEEFEKVLPRLSQLRNIGLQGQFPHLKEIPRGIFPIP